MKRKLYFKKYGNRHGTIRYYSRKKISNYFNNGWSSHLYKKRKSPKIDHFNAFDALKFLRYGLSAQDIARVLKQQDYSCAICLKSFKVQQFIIDHSHKTGLFRGLLCRGCNDGLGKLGDDVRGLKRALDYLSSKHE